MKKHFLIVALTLFFVNVCPVFASDFVEITNDNNTGETKIIYTVSDSYLISIPEAFNLKQGEEVSRTVYAEGVCIEYGTELQIKISGANCSGDEAWYIVDETPGSEANKYEYTIGTESELADVKNNSVVLTVQAGDIEGEYYQELFFNLKDTVTKSGIYSDTLTFFVSTAEVESID